MGLAISKQLAEMMGGNVVSLSSPKRQWETLAAVEERYIAEVLAATGGNKQAAARILGIDRKTLTRNINRTVAAA